MAAEHSDLLLRANVEDISVMAHSIIERYERAEIDAVYIVYNEFKSVIQQRVVVEKLLPIRKLGEHEITVAEVMTEEQRDAAAKAAGTVGISINAPEDTQIDAEAKKFGTAEVDYIYDQAPERLFRHLMPRYVTTQILHAVLESIAAEHAAAYDGHGCGDQKCGRSDRQAVVEDESRSPGSDHQGNYRDCERSGRNLTWRFSKRDLESYGRQRKCGNCSCHQRSGRGCAIRRSEHASDL